MISCILLSAGYSSRFVSPKALARLNGETVIERIQRSLLDALIEEIIIVLGDSADKIEPFVLDHRRVKFVYNKNHNFGQTSSFKCGLNSISPEAKGFLLLPVDYPFINSITIRAIVEEFSKGESDIILPSYHGRKGHPPLFCSELRKEFLGLDNDTGLNMVANNHKHKERVSVLNVDDQGVIMSFNTQEEFEYLKKQII